MTAFQSGLHVCMNCGNPTKGKHNFQGVILCSGCRGLANTCISSCDGQLAQLRVIYIESLRVALASGRLRTTNAGIKSEASAHKPSIDDFKMLLGKLVELKDVGDSAKDDQKVESKNAGDGECGQGRHSDGNGDLILRDPSNSIA